MAAALACLGFQLGLYPATNAEGQSPPDDGWQYGAYLDAGYGGNFNFPDNHQWRSKQTTPRTNELAPNMGLAYLRKEPRMGSRWGMELAVQGGYDTKELVPREHPMSGADTLRHLARANISYLAPVGNGLELTAGLMKGFINYESFYAKDNFNYTRAYLTDYNPNFILAIGGRYPITPNVNAGLHILNGFQYLSHSNNLPSYGAELDWRITTRTTLYQNVYYGPDQPETHVKFWRAFSDSTLQWRGDSLTFALSYDIGTERSSADAAASRQFWMASALYARWELGGPLAVALRPEMFWDRNGLMTQAQQLLWAITSTLDYKQHLGPQLAVVRLEYRYDRSSGPEGGFFTDGETVPGTLRLVRDQHVIWVGLMWAFDS
ncbi:outer membrane beta-barrel protein [Nitrospira sp. Nam74]